ncbi:MAG: hypothetical protein ACE361_10605 [Aureliella sp.]
MKTHLRNGIAATLAFVFFTMIAKDASAQTFGMVTSKYSSNSTCGPNGCGNRSFTASASTVSYATPIRTSSTSVVGTDVARPTVTYSVPSQHVGSTYYSTSVRSYQYTPPRSYRVATSASTCSASSSSRVVSYGYAPSASYYGTYRSCR